MTFEKALEILRTDNSYICVDCFGNCEECDYFISQDIAIESLEKQVPRRPMSCDFPEYPTKVGVCPICEEQVNGDMKFCDQCGQRLDWSDKE